MIMKIRYEFYIILKSKLHFFYHRYSFIIPNSLKLVPNKVIFLNN
jgi:hypothetical protein